MNSMKLLSYMLVWVLWTCVSPVTFCALWTCELFAMYIKLFPTLWPYMNSLKVGELLVSISELWTFEPLKNETLGLSNLLSLWAIELVSLLLSV
jgi:hypothetical protein